MTCRVVRRGAGVAAAVFWVAAVAAVALLPEAAHTNKVMLLTAAAVTASVVAGVGYFLSKGSAEAVFEMGRRAGINEERERYLRDEVERLGADNVSFLPTRRVGL